MPGDVNYQPKTTLGAGPAAPQTTNKGAVGSSSTASAKQAQNQSVQNSQNPPTSIYAKVDTNKNFIVSAAEVANSIMTAGAVSAAALAKTAGKAGKDAATLITEEVNKTFADTKYEGTEESIADINTKVDAVKTTVEKSVKGMVTIENAEEKPCPNAKIEEKVQDFATAALTKYLETGTPPAPADLPVLSTKIKNVMVDVADIFDENATDNDHNASDGSGILRGSDGTKVTVIYEYDGEEYVVVVRSDKVPEGHNTTMLDSSGGGISTTYGAFTEVVPEEE